MTNFVLLLGGCPLKMAAQVGSFKMLGLLLLLSVHHQLSSYIPWLKSMASS